MSIEQRLERIEQRQLQILQLLGVDQPPAQEIPRRDSVRRAEALARRARLQEAKRLRQ